MKETKNNENNIFFLVKKLGLVLATFLLLMQKVQSCSLVPAVIISVLIWEIYESSLLK
jgi:glucose dehydrogenase